MKKERGSASSVGSSVSSSKTVLSSPPSVAHKTLEELVAEIESGEKRTALERVEDSFGPVWWPTRRFFVDVRHNIKEFFRRVFRGYTNYDVYEMRTAHAERMVTLLKKLKETKIGYPARSGISSEDDWNKIIDGMIDGFQAALEMDEAWSEPEKSKREERYKALDERFDNGMRLFREYYFELWD